MNSKKSVAELGANDSREITGRVGTINISGSGAQFQFDLVTNNKVRYLHALGSTNPVGFATMAALVMSAYTVGKKIHVRSEKNSEGLFVAVDIRVGAKSKIPKNEKMKATVRGKTPVPEANQVSLKVN